MPRAQRKLLAILEAESEQVVSFVKAGAQHNRSLKGTDGLHWTAGPAPGRGQLVVDWRRAIVELQVALVALGGVGKAVQRVVDVAQFLLGSGIARVERSSHSEVPQRGRQRFGGVAADDDGLRRASGRRASIALERDRAAVGLDGDKGLARADALSPHDQPAVFAVPLDRLRRQKPAAANPPSTRSPAMSFFTPAG